MVNMLQKLMDKARATLRTHNIRRDGNSKNEKEMVRGQNIVTEMKRAFDYQKKHAEERTAELNNILQQKLPKLKSKEEKTKIIKGAQPKNCGQ